MSSLEVNLHISPVEAVELNRHRVLQCHEQCVHPGDARDWRRSFSEQRRLLHRHD